MSSDYPLAKALGRLTASGPSSTQLQDPVLLEEFPVVFALPERDPKTFVALREGLACLEWLVKVRDPGPLGDLTRHLFELWPALLQPIAMSEPATDMAETILAIPAATDNAAPLTVLDARKQCWGWFHDAPLYCLLLHLSGANENPSLRDSLLPIAAHVFLSFFALADDFRKRGSSLAPARGACLLTRQIAQGMHSQIPPLFTADALTTECVRKRLAAAVSEHPDDPEVQKARDYLVLFSYAAKIRAVRTRDPTIERPPVDEPSELEPKKEPPNPTDRAQPNKSPRLEKRVLRPFKNTSFVQIRPHPEDDESENFANAEPPTSKKKRVTIRGRIPSNPGENPSLSLRSARGMFSRLARFNQRLPLASNRPRKAELQLLFRALEAAIAARKRTLENLDHRLKCETILMVLMILATGTDPERIYDTRLIQHETKRVPNQPALREETTPSGFVRLFWLVEIPCPEMNPDRYQSVADMLEPVHDHIWFQLPDNVANAIVDLFKTKHISVGQRVFVSAFSEIVTDLRKSLTKINTKEHTRLRFSALPDVLFMQIIETTAHRSYAWIICGQGDPTVHIPLVYQTTHVDALHSAYQSAAEALLMNFNRPKNQTAPPEYDLLLPTHYYGSPLRPKRHTLTALTHELRAAVESPPNAHADLKRIVQYHNAYCLYTTILLLCGTGMRPVRDPLECAADIDWHSGVFFIADKAVRGDHSHRSVVLPPIVMRQFRAYRRHLKALIVAFQKERTKTCATFIQIACDGTARTVPFLFFLTEDFAITSVSPSLIDAQMLHFYPAPTNWPRHHLRTMLVETGCPDLWIDAQLGHDVTGLEPWGRYCSMSFEHLSKLAEDFIEPILLQDGWVSLDGMTI